MYFNLLCWRKLLKKRLAWKRWKIFFLNLVLSIIFFGLLLFCFYFKRNEVLKANVYLKKRTSNLSISKNQVNQEKYYKEMLRKLQFSRYVFTENKRLVMTIKNIEEAMPVGIRLLALTRKKSTVLLRGEARHESGITRLIKDLKSQAGLEHAEVMLLQKPKQDKGESLFSISVQLKVLVYGGSDYDH